MQERMIIQSPSAGFPKAKKANRSTHASMLINITILMPKRFRKKGIARMNRVSETCEMDMMIVEYFTTSESLY